MIPQAILEELKEKADIVKVISTYIPLQKKGKNYLALCPFHSEKTPSFTVSQEKGLFHCFGCGKGGNVFTFVMEMEKAGFAEAAEIIGEKIGIHVENDKSDSEKASLFDKYYSIMEMACKFFESNLDLTSEYLLKRGIKNPKVFRLGCAPDAWDGLLKYLTNKGIKEEDLEKSGLILQREKSEGYYDRFRNRLMFPITDHRKRVIGFSGRSLGDEEPKYLNSPDTAIFIKGENLYNLGLAKDAIKKEKAVLLVEGNIDVATVFEAGIENVVAPLGTAFTSSQAKLIKRFTDLAVIMFDNDTAGIAAEERTQEILKEAGMRVRIANYKNAKDPDELVKKFGKDALIESIKSSYPATEYKIRRIVSRFNLDDTEARVRAAHEVVVALSNEPDKILQGEYVKLSSELLKIPEERLAQELRNKESYFGKKSNLRRITDRPPSRVIEAQRKLIRLIVEWDQAIPRIKDEVELESFGELKSIVEKLMEQKAAEALESMSEADAKTLREIMLSDEPMDDKEIILIDCINSLKANNVQNKLNELKATLANPEKTGSLEALKQMNQEYLNLNEILRTLIR